MSAVSSRSTRPTRPARPARPGRRALATGLTAATALAATTVALVPSQAAPASYSVAYTCTSSVSPGETFALPMDVTVDARRSGGVTTLEVPGSSPVLSEKDTYANVRLTTTLDATVDGSPVKLTSDKVVTIRPNEPVDLPPLVGTTTHPTGSTVAFVPGTFVLVVKISIINATQTCLLDGAAPTVTVPVGDPAPSPTAAPTPSPTAEPTAPTAPPTTTPTSTPTNTPTPTAGPTTEPTTAPTTTPSTAPTADPTPPLLHLPRVSARLSKKTQRVGRKPATVLVTLKPSRAGAAPAGKVKVTVGKRKVRTVTVSAKSARRIGTKGRTLRIKLPKNLKPGRHTVKVHVAWKEKELFGTQQRTMKLRVKKR